jgi:SsrA-binding protein
MPDNDSLLIKNKKAYHLYAVLETVEAGIALMGTEVKSVRAKNVSFTDAYVRISGEEAWLENLHIGEYPPAAGFNHEPRRRRRLLLHKAQIRRLMGKCREKGLTIIPLAIYTRGAYIKVELGLARGKQTHDKREDIARREAMVRAVRLPGRTRDEAGHQRAVIYWARSSPEPSPVHGPRPLPAHPQGLPAPVA